MKPLVKKMAQFFIVRIVRMLRGIPGKEKSKNEKVKTKSKNGEKAF